MTNKLKAAILDDFQAIALNLADWEGLETQIEVTVFSDHIDNADAIIKRLKPFDIVCVMRERTPLNSEILMNLPNLKLIVSTGERNASIDIKVAAELGITIRHTRYVESGAPELTWALIMALARNIPLESQHMRSGAWQSTIGSDLRGKTLGIIGLGRVGTQVAQYAQAFNMNILAWSVNLTEEKATNVGAQLVDKLTLFREADFITIHLILSKRSKFTVTAADFEQMKSSAFFINTSRGQLVDQDALIAVLQQKRIAGAALDVYDQEPLPALHPFRHLENVLATPHIGYVTENTYKVFYQDTVKAIRDWVTQ